MCKVYIEAKVICQSQLGRGHGDSAAHSTLTLHTRPHTQSRHEDGSRMQGVANRVRLHMMGLITPRCCSCPTFNLEIKHGLLLSDGRAAQEIGSKFVV